jgi:hypothetical protein
MLLVFSPLAKMYTEELAQTQSRAWSNATFLVD